MFLRFFRFNDPYRLLAILILLVLVSAALFFDPVNLTLAELKFFVLGEALNDHKSLYSEIVTSTPPLTAWFFGWVEFVFGRSVTPLHILAFLAIIFQGGYFAILLIGNKAQSESTYLPALIYGLLCFFSFDMLSLSAELLAAFFLLFALNNLFKEVEFKIQRDSTVLTLGVYLGIASLLVFSYVVFLPGALVILVIFSRLAIRKALLLVFGFLLPHALLMVIYFITDDLSVLWNNFYKGHEWLRDNLMSLSSIMYLSAVPIVYFVFSLIMLNREARLTKYQSQLLQIMFLWLLVAIIEVTLAGSMSAHRMIAFVPPLAYFTSHLLLLIRRKWIAETMLWLFIGGIVTVSYMARYQKLKGIDYQKLFYKRSAYADQIKDKRILILTTDWGLYEANSMAAYYFDWKLSEEVFKQPDYFENIVSIDQSFVKDAPDVIVDKDNLMAKIIERIPRLRHEYVRKGELYVRISK